MCTLGSMHVTFLSISVPDGTVHTTLLHKYLIHKHWAVKIRSTASRTRFEANLETTYCTEHASSDDESYFSCSQLSTLGASGIVRWHVWISEGSDADRAIAPSSYAHARIGGMIGVSLDVSWEAEL